MNLTSTKSSLIQELESVDWSFPSLSNSGLNAFHWYPATYIPAIPGSIIPLISSPGDIVLDPFCGSGSTGIEAVRLGREFIGIDSNSVAILISEAKLSFLPSDEVLKELDKIVNNSNSIFANNVDDHPNQNELLHWYHPRTLNELNGILTAILQIPDRLMQRTLLAIFSAILKNCSSQGRHWGWVCDNVKPKPGEITFKSANEIFINAVRGFSEASENAFKECEYQSPQITRETVRKKSILVHGSCIDHFSTIPSESIDAIVTSPPYNGVADYVKSQRLTYLWLDKDELASDKLGFRAFKELRSIEMGARANRYKANSHSSYLMFMEKFFTDGYRLMKPGGQMCLVVGESPSRAGTTDLLIDLAIKHGFKVETRVKRNIKSSRRRLMANVMGEDILFFSKK